MTLFVGSSDPNRLQNNNDAFV